MSVFTALPPRRGGLWLLGAALLIGCHAPPRAALIPESRGDFGSSQVKPAPSGRSALADLPVDADRRRAQQGYFARRALGERVDKAQLLGPRGTPLEAGVRDSRATAVSHLVVRLHRGQSVELETRSLSAGADPVLHLWSRERGTEVARDDDSGSEAGAARLRFRAEEAGTYLVLLHAYTSPDEGWCQLWIDGELRLDRARIGGTALLVAGGRDLEAVLLNDGDGAEPWPPSERAATDPVLLLLDADTGALLALDDDSGVELGARLAPLAATEEGRSRIALVAAYSTDAEGTARLVVNDRPFRDSDKDGLGDALEAALCTCRRRDDRPCGFDCTQAATPEDTDGDGVSDAAEVLGQDDAEFPQLLPRWGADPRHKDLWVEIDLARWVDRESKPPVTRFGRTLEPEEARAAVRAFARLTGMENPDGTDGLRLHLDLGRSCGPQPSGIDQVCGDLCALGWDGARRCGQSFYPGPPAPRRDGLARARRHLFHVAVADCLVSGQAPGEPADSLEYDCDRFTAMVHELGHNLGLGHHYGTFETGGGNCKPNYPSVMNYAYSDRFAGGIELQFSNGALVGPGDLDPRDLDETRPFGGPDAEVGWLAGRPFYYSLHDCISPGRGCKVDFNRDGRLDPSVRAFLSPMPGYGAICEGEHGNALGSESLEGLSASSGPAGAELRSRRPDGSAALALHVFAPVLQGDGSALRMSRTFGASGGWSSWQKVEGPPLRRDTQPAAVTVVRGAQEEIWVFACTEGESPIHYAVLGADGSLSSLEPVPHQPSWLRARDVSVTVRGSDLVLLVRDDRLDGGDRVYLTQHTAAGWSPVFLQVTAEGAPLRSTVTPALALASDGRIYVVTGEPSPPPGAGPPGRIHWYSSAAESPYAVRDEDLEGLRFEDGLPGAQHETWSRPALAFVPHQGGDGRALPDGRGYLALWWNRGTRTRHLWTWGRLDREGADFSLGRWYHYEAYGYTDAIAGSGPALVVRQGTRLTALLSQSDLDPGKVRHVPFADGIPEGALTLRDHDDRPAIRAGLCRGLNWECPERCNNLGDRCAGEGRAAFSEISCKLPRWSEESSP